MIEKEKLEIKKQLIHRCKEILEQNASNAKIAMDEHQQMANEYGPPKDRYDSFRMQMLRKRDMFAVQYQKFVDEILLLEKIDLTKTYKKAEFGSVIITNKQKMFVFSGLGKIKFENQDFFIISTQVPIFNAIKGYKIGDKYTYNNINAEILDLF